MVLFSVVTKHELEAGAKCRFVRSVCLSVCGCVLSVSFGTRCVSYPGNWEQVINVGIAGVGLVCIKLLPGD